MSVASGFCERDDRFRLVTQDNQGLGPARNTGAREATGEYLTFVDSDDVVALPAYERLVEGLTASGSDFATYGACRFSNVGVMPSLVQAKVCATSRTGTPRPPRPGAGDGPDGLEQGLPAGVLRGAGAGLPGDAARGLPGQRAGARPGPRGRRRRRGRSTRGGCATAASRSITQRSAEVGNVADRLSSALDVLDVLEAEAPEALPVVRRHLLEVDVPAMVAAVFVNSGGGPDPAAGDGAATRRPARTGRGDGLDPVPPGAGRAGGAGRPRRAAGAAGAPAHPRQAGHRRTPRAVAQALRRGPAAARQQGGPGVGVRTGRRDASSWPSRWRTPRGRRRPTGVLELDLSLVTGTVLGDDSTRRRLAGARGGGRPAGGPRQPERYRRHHPRVGDDLGGLRLRIDPEALAEPSGRLKGGFWRLMVELRSATLDATAAVLAPSLGRGRFAPDRLRPRPQRAAGAALPPRRRVRAAAAPPPGHRRDAPPRGRASWSSPAGCAPRRSAPRRAGRRLPRRRGVAAPGRGHARQRSSARTGGSSYPQRGSCRSRRTPTRWPPSGCRACSCASTASCGRSRWARGSAARPRSSARVA